MLAHLKSTLYESYPVMPVSMKKYANSVGVLFKEGWGWGLGCDPVGWSKWKSQKVALWYRELLLHCIHLLYLEINCCHRLYSSHPDAIPAIMIMYSLSPVKALLIDADWLWLMLWANSMYILPTQQHIRNKISKFPRRYCCYQGDVTLARPGSRKKRLYTEHTPYLSFQICHWIFLHAKGRKFSPKCTKVPLKSATFTL